MTVTTRFAPSPTGRLHVGNIRTALHNWLLAKKAGGRFLLRIDDTDAARSEERFVEAIRDDLAWLGLEPDGEERQSARLAVYEEAFEPLSRGRVYPAYETAQELDLKRKVQLGRGLPPIYDRAALALTDAERAAKEAEGIAPHWRFKLDQTRRSSGSTASAGRSISSPRRFGPGGAPRRRLVAVHAAERGRRHRDGRHRCAARRGPCSNTAVQIQMFTALAPQPPRSRTRRCWSAAKASCRSGSARSAATRARSGDRARGDRGVAGAAGNLACRSSRLPIAKRWSRASISASFGRAPAQFDEAELARLNAAIVHQLPFDQVADRLPEGWARQAGRRSGRTSSASADAARLVGVVTGPVEPPRSMPRRAPISPKPRAAASVERRSMGRARPPRSRSATGRKGKALFLRCARRSPGAIRSRHARAAAADRRGRGAHAGSRPALRPDACAKAGRRI